MLGLKTGQSVIETERVSGKQKGGMPKCWN